MHLNSSLQPARHHWLFKTLLVCSGGMMLVHLHALGQYALEGTSIDPGGTSKGGNYSLDCTIGPPEAATMVSGGSYSLEIGFSAVIAVPTPDAPRLTIQSTTSNAVVVSWPASAEDFSLQQNSNLNSPGWTAPPQTVNTSGDSKFLVVNQPTGNLFFRLIKSGASVAYQVVNLNDSGSGSLRAMILAATNNTQISFAPGLEGVIALTSGELVLNKNLTIVGPGATILAVSGSDLGRVLNVTGTVKISGLAIRDGLIQGGSSADGRGGGVLNSGNLVLSNCALVANVAVGGNGANGVNSNGGVGGNGLGGGIYSTETLDLVNCTLAANEARGGNGGPGSDSAGDFGFRGGAGGGGLGGAICNDGNMTMTNCTFASNRVTGGTGGNGGEGGLTQGRGGNGGGAEGAGVLNRLSCQSANVTMTSGVSEGGVPGTGSPNGTTGSGLGGGFRTTSASAFFVNSLIAQNTLGSSLAVANGFDISGAVVSQGYNLVGITNGSSTWIASDKVGNDVSPLNPLLDLLQDNGGWIPTIALQPGSPAIDQGKNIGLTTDQRGLPRPVDQSGVANASGGDGSDIGAFELVFAQ